MTFSNTAAELAIIRTILKRADGFLQVKALRAEDFTDAELRTVYAAAARLYDEHKTIDLPHLAEIIGDDAVMTISKRVTADTVHGSEYNAAENIRILKGMAERRRLEALCHASLDALHDLDRDADGIRDELRQELRRTDAHITPEDDLQTMLVNALDKLSALQNGDVKIIRTGLDSLDRIIGGFLQGEMTILGARTSVGKSAMALHFAVEAAKQGFRVLYFSTEMSDHQIVMRLFQRYAALSNASVLRTGAMTENDMAELAAAVDEIEHLPLEFRTHARYLEDVHSAIADAVDGNGVDLVILDYLQQVRTRTRYKSDFERLNEISATIKEWTLEFNMPIIALAQVGRTADGKMPTLAELRGSGNMEQDADNVLFLHRVDRADDSCLTPPGGRIDDRSLFNTLLSMREQYIAVSVAKQRQGNVGFASIIFNPERMQYRSIMRR